MADVRAADLPDGSVVAATNVVYIKNHPTQTAAWRATNRGYVGDWAVDNELAGGAKVLRHGYGD